jgi:sulfoacetaldehyde dehydrogenase
MAKMSEAEVKQYVSGLVARARKAQAVLATYTQEQGDRLVGAIAYGVTRPEVEAELAELALRDTELGDYPSKIGKVDKKVKGIYREIKHEKTVGVIEEIPERGMRRIAKPVGVIGALIPSTQPEMLPMTKALFGIKCRDALIFCPHPRGRETTIRTTQIMRNILKANGAPEDILICAEHVSVDVTDEVMKQVDLVVATGGSGMVKAAYSSGTPAFGVGAGNACLVVDDTADIKDAAHKTMLSKTGDLAAGCSCDNSLIIFESIYNKMIDALKAEGGYLCTPAEKAKVQKALFPTWPADHVLNRDMVAKPVDVIGKLCGIDFPAGTKFIMVEETGSGPDYPFSGEKMCVVLTVYKCKDIDDHRHPHRQRQPRLFRRGPLLRHPFAQRG